MHGIARVLPDSQRGGESKSKPKEVMGSVDCEATCFTKDFFGAVGIACDNTTGFCTCPNGFSSKDQFYDLGTTCHVNEELKQNMGIFLLVCC